MKPSGGRDEQVQFTLATLFKWIFIAFFLWNTIVFLASRWDVFSSGHSVFLEIRKSNSNFCKDCKGKEEDWGKYSSPCVEACAIMGRQSTPFREGIRALVAHSYLCVYEPCGDFIERLGYFRAYGIIAGLILGAYFCQRVVINSASSVRTKEGRSWVAVLLGVAWQFVMDFCKMLFHSAEKPLHEMRQGAGDTGNTW